MAEATATIRIVGKDDASRELGKVSDALGGLGVKGVAAGVVLGELGANALMKVGRGMEEFAKQSVEAAANLELVQRRGEAIFKDAFPQLNKQMADLSNQLGRNQSDLQSFANDLGALFQGSGLANTQVADLSKSVAQLSVDLASFTGASDQDAFDALRSGLLGMERPLRNLGVVISDTDVKNEALALGIKKSTDQMSDAQLMILRYGVALQKTKDAQGDAERNQDSYQNSVKKLQASWNDLEEALGKPTLPLLAETFSDLAGIVQNGVIPAFKVAGANFEWFGGVIDKYMPGLVQALGAVRDLVTYMAQTPTIKSYTPDIGADDIAKANAAAEKNGTTIRQEIEKSQRAAKDATPDLKAMWNAASGGAPSGDSKKAEDALKKLSQSMSDLDNEYWSARSDIDRALGTLVNDHKDKMGQINEEIKTVKQSMEDLEKTFQRSNAGMDESEADTINSAKEKIDELQRKLDDLGIKKQSQQQQGLGVDLGLQNDIDATTAALQKEKDGLAAVMQQAAASSPTEGNIEATQKRISDLQTTLQGLFNDKTLQAAKGSVTAGLNTYIKQVQDSLATEQARLAGLEAKAPSADILQMATDRAGMSDAQRKFADDEKKRQQDKADHDTKMGQLQDELKKFQDKQTEENAAYKAQRQELEETKQKMLDFHDTYVTNITDIDKVTQEKVDSLKKKLDDLKTTISNIDALMKARPDITGGQTITSQAKARAAGGVVTESMTLVGERGPELVSLPYGSKVYPNSRNMSGSVSIQIGEVHVHNEADENRFMKKLAREIQKLKIHAN